METGMNHFMVPTRIDHLELSVKATMILKTSGYFYVWEICCLPEEKISGIFGCGPKTIKEIKEELNRYGLDFGMTATSIKKAFSLDDNILRNMMLLSNMYEDISKIRAEITDLGLKITRARNNSSRVVESISKFKDILCAFNKGGDDINNL